MSKHDTCCDGQCQKPSFVVDDKAMPNLTDTHKQTCLAPKAPWQWQFLALRYWGVWLLLALLLPLVCLPLRAQFFLGRQLGKVAFLLAKRRVQDTLTNLSLAFANKSEHQRIADCQASICQSRYWRV